MKTIVRIAASVVMLAALAFASLPSTGGTVVPSGAAPIPTCDPYEQQCPRK